MNYQQQIERDAECLASWREASLPVQYPAMLFSGTPPQVIHGEHWRAVLAGVSPGYVRYWIHVDLQAQEAASAHANQP